MLEFGLNKTGRLQFPTGLKTLLHILFWKSPEWRKCSKISKNQINLGKTVPFSLKLKVCSPEFQTSTEIDPKKIVFW